jgi:vacuolar-type H+-ATPase subunit I/STV1
MKVPKPKFNLGDKALWMEMEDVCLDELEDEPINEQINRYKDEVSIVGIHIYKKGIYYDVKCGGDNSYDVPERNLFCSVNDIEDEVETFRMEVLKSKAQRIKKAIKNSEGVIEQRVEQYRKSLEDDVSGMERKLKSINSQIEELKKNMLIKELAGIGND